MRNSIWPLKDKLKSYETLVYSVHVFDKPFLENAAKGKHELIYSESFLEENSVNLATGCEAVALFATDIGSEIVIEQLYGLGVRFITLRSVGYDHLAVCKAKALGMKVANVPAYSPYAVA